MIQLQTSDRTLYAFVTPSRKSTGCSPFHDVECFFSLAPSEAAVGLTISCAVSAATLTKNSSNYTQQSYNQLIDSDRFIHGERIK